jgi:LemA protein
VVWLWVALGVAVLLAVVLVLGYNRLVRLRNEVDTGWANIEVQLERRADLIPNLVEAVKGYAAHERQVFQEVTEARAALVRAGSPHAAAEADDLLSAALGRLFAVAEAYPDLQADENFRQLQSELSETENRIAISRQVYNDTVLTFNNAIQTVPGVFFAGFFGFSKREFFDVEDDAQREPPQVSFTPGAPAG